MDGLIHRLLLITILYRMAFSFTTESPLFDDEEEDPYDEDERDEGVIVNTGGEGVAETDALKHMDDVERKKENALPDDGDEDDGFQGQILYQEWLEDCATNNDSTPYIPDEVLQYMNDNYLSVDDQRETCKSMRNSEGKRGKRFLMKGSGIWDKCIIPYTFDKSFDDAKYKSDQMKILQVHKLFRLTTGFRFVEYNNTNSQMGLGHNNYINYIAGNHPCASPSIGNSRTWNGQWLRACGSEYVIIHELGHAMGFHHETEEISGMYSGVTHPNTNNMLGKPFRIYETNYVHKDAPFLDLTSVMGYYISVSTNRGYGYRWHADEPELTQLISRGDYYYYFKELQEFNKCYDAFDSCSPLPVCAFGGYTSVVNDVCSCRCPEGLNPDTRCSTLTEVINSGSWPVGTFTLLMVKGATCPKGLSVGQMTRWNHEQIWEKGTSLSKGKMGDLEFVFDVCTQTTSSTDSGEWPAGEYCLLKRGDCPKGFGEGLAETWGKVPARENSSYGALPDGKKGQDFEFQFCCRDDGHHSIPISLPNRTPFILYAKPYCQKVTGMHQTREYYVTSADLTKNLTYSGSLPYLYHKEKLHGYYFTYYCVYRPYNMAGECGGVKKFSPGEKTYTFTSPNYPEAYSQNSECLWHFESPKGTTMKIEFDDFEVSTKDDSGCKSYVELRTVHAGNRGYRICGHYEKKPRLTVYNSLTVKLATSPDDDAQKGFKATVTVLSESEQCYTGNGSETYVGKMDYTRSFRPCLPWSKVTHCILHQFSHYTMDKDLSNNYCRNTMGRMPWCYVNAELCERENCDVCMRDRCYDVLPHCASIVKENADFCSKNDLGEARRTCMKTCGFCEEYKPKAAYTTVTCSAPGAVTEINPTPVKTSYKVGDEVSYSCPSSHVARKRICQSDGTWSPLGYVCSGCSDGWTYVRGRCFKYQPNTLLKYWPARALCEGLNSTLAVVDSDEQATEVMELQLGDINLNENIHIGIQQKDGAWVGDDGSVPQNISWSPNTKPDPSRCMVGKGYQTLYTAWCGYAFNVMCSRQPTGPFVCEDDYSNCPEILAKHPGMCEEYPDYAWTHCRKTCGVSGSGVWMKGYEDEFPHCHEMIAKVPGFCEQYPDYALTKCRKTCGVSGCTKTSSCTVPNVENGKQIHGSSSTIKQGQYVEYKCNDGFLLKSGNLNRTCLSTGSFNGDLPVCSVPDEAASITLFTGVDFFRRATYLRSYFNYPEVFNGKQYRIPTTGKITAWQFFASEAGEITFFVWRQKENSKLEYTLVGKNTLTVTADNRAVTMAVSAGDQIAAKAGDMLGFVLPSKPVITFSSCRKDFLPEFTTWLSTPTKYYAAAMTVGTSYAFKEYEWKCRVYSINAVLQPTS